MKKIALLTTFALLLMAPLAGATTYVMMADEDLADDARVIVRARVLETRVVDVDGRPYTEYLMQVEDAVKGARVGEQLRVRILGGVLPSGVGLKIWGVPEFTAQESVIAFLGRGAHGEYGFEQMALGAFRVGRTVEGRQVAYRDLSGATALQMDTPHRRQRERSLQQAHLPRDAAAFVDWLRDHTAGTEREPDYFLAATERPVLPERQAFSLLSSDGRNIRWSEFTSPGGSATWKMYRKGQKGLAKKGRNAIKEALRKWSRVFNINLVWGGKTGNKNGFTNFDEENVVAFNDPRSDIDGSFGCSTGGVVAIGGPWFSSSVLDGSFFKALSADVVFQDNLACFFAGGIARVGAEARVKGPDVVAAEVAAHELGHTLGLGHSCENTVPCGNAKANDALMRWAVHNDGRGAAINRDDKKGAKKLGYKGR